jgi:hypothetical protein
MWQLTPTTSDSAAKRLSCNSRRNVDVDAELGLLPVEIYDGFATSGLMRKLMGALCRPTGDFVQSNHLMLGLDIEHQYAGMGRIRFLLSCDAGENNLSDRPRP